MKSFSLLLLDCNFVVSHTKQEKRHLHVYVGTRSCQGQPLQCPYMYMCLCIEVCFVFMVSSGRQILLLLECTLFKQIRKVVSHSLYWLSISLRTWPYRCSTSKRWSFMVFDLSSDHIWLHVGFCWTLGIL